MERSECFLLMKVIKYDLYEISCANLQVGSFDAGYGASIMSRLVIIEARLA